MILKATIQPGYRWRPALVAVFSLVFGAWFLYDGYYQWPKDRMIAQKFNEF